MNLYSLEQENITIFIAANKTNRQTVLVPVTGNIMVHTLSGKRYFQMHQGSKDEIKAAGLYIGWNPDLIKQIPFLHQ